MSIGKPIKCDFGRVFTSEELGFNARHWQVSQEAIDQARKIDEQQAIFRANCELLVGCV